MCCCFAIFVTVPAPNIRDLKIHRFRVRVRVNQPFMQPLIREDCFLITWEKRVGYCIKCMVSPLSHLGKNGCFLQNYELNMFAYPYSQVEMVYVKVAIEGYQKSRQSFVCYAMSLHNCQVNNISQLILFVLCISRYAFTHLV